MIDKVILKNFQAHKYTEVDFCGGYNVIVGDNDQGKTSVLRAILWVLTNKPGGDSFIRHGQKEVCVTLYINGYVVKREKSATKNNYYLGDEKFTAFGNNVPEEIKAVMNIDSINIQQQQDPLFLLSKTPGEVARYLNKIVHLESIDLTVKNIQKGLRDNVAELKFLKKHADEKKEALRKYDFLWEMEVDVKCMEEAEKGRQKYNQKIQNLNDIIGQLIAFQKRQFLLENMVKPERIINKILHFLAEKKIQEKQSIQLRGLVRANNDLQEKISICKKEVGKDTIVNKLVEQYINRKKINVQFTKLKKLIDQYNGAMYIQTGINENIVYIQPLINDLGSLFSQKKTCQQGLSGLQISIRKHKKLQFEINKFEKDLQKAELFFKENMPAECPLCGAQINNT